MIHRRHIVLLGLVVAAPLLAALIVAISRTHWFPAGDMAQAELHMRGFFRHPPLVGAAGRIVSDSGVQGSHPGPSLWVAMLPIYVIGGRTSAALMTAVVSVHLASIAALLYLAFRRGGALLSSLVAGGVLAIVRSSGPDFMIEPWNPWLAILPFAVFIFLVLEILAPSESVIMSRLADPVARESLQLACLVAVGTHCLQCHAGYVVLTLPMILVSTVVVSRRVWGRGSESLMRRVRILVTTLFVPTAVLVAMWVPPLLDQIRRKPGNLSILVEHFGSPSEPTLGVKKVLEIVTTQFNVLGPWLSGPSGASSTSIRLIGFALAGIFVASAVIVAHGSGLTSQKRVLVILVGFSVLGVYSFTRIFGPFYEYTVRWAWILTAVTLSVSMWVLVEARNRRPARTGVGSPPRSGNSSRSPSVRVKGAWIGLLALSVLTTWQAIDRVNLPGATDSRIISGVIANTSSALDPDKTYQIRFYDPYTLNATGFGLLLELERRGFRVKVDPSFAAAALPHRTAPMEACDEVLWVVVGPAVERADRDPQLSRIAFYNPRTSNQRARATRLLVEISDGLRAAGRADLVSSLDQPGASLLFAEPPLPESTARLVRELIRMGQPTGIYLMNVGSVAKSLG